MYEFDWTSIPGAIPLLAKGILVTLEVTLTAIAVGVVWGTLLAVARLGRNRLLSWLAAVYVNLFRSVLLVLSRPREQSGASIQWTAEGARAAPSR